MTIMHTAWHVEGRRGNFHGKGMADVVMSIEACKIIGG